MAKIMIVEDEDDVRDMLLLLLTKEGYDTTAVTNGKEFLDHVDTIQPDLITLDVMMPGMTTYEILKQLQTKTNHPKIILLTVVHYSNEEIQRLAQISNVIDYIPKPFNIRDLVDRIKTHLAEAPT